MQKSSFLQVGHRREQGGVDKGGRKGNEKAKVSSDGSTHDGKGRRNGNITIERGLHYPVRVKLDLELAALCRSSEGVAAKNVVFE